MTYNMLRNAECVSGHLRYKWKYMGRNGASQASFAIDELNRLFSWGQNGIGQAGQGDPNIDESVHEIEFCTQIGEARDWVKVSSGEISSIALNEKGELWGWGDSPCDNAAWGLPVGYFGGAARTYVPVRCAPGSLFKDVAHQYYLTVAIGTDDKLYTFGDNSDYGLGIGGVEGNNYNTPQLNPYITEDVKLIDSELFCSAVVTATNRVYLFGCNWWWTYTAWDGYWTGVPWEVTGLPVGSVITQVAVCYWGVAVLLDNGQVWKAGNDVLFMDTTDYSTSGNATFEQVTEWSSYNMIKICITALGSFAFFGVSDAGNIYGFSDTGYTGWNGNTLPHSPPWYQQMLVGAEFEGNRKYVDFCSNEHNNVWHAIDDQGFLWSWGTQTWSSHLGIGKKSNSSLGRDDTDDYDIVLTAPYPILAAPAHDWKGEPALLNNGPVWLSEYTQPYPQLADHEPCGHWHIRRFVGAEDYPRNCWMPSLSLQGNELFFVAAGRHLQSDLDTGNEILFLSYQIDANIWTLINTIQLRMSAVFPGGADFDGSIYGFANYKSDVSGSRFNEVYTNQGMGVWIWDGTTSRETTFADSCVCSGANKFAVFNTGLCALAYEDTAGQLIVKVSTDSGATWVTRHTVAPNALRKDYSLIIDSNGYIYLAHQISANYIKTERSINQGVGWTVQDATSYFNTGILSLKLIEDNGRLMILTATAVRFGARYSSNNGASWVSFIGITYPSYTSIIAHSNYTTKHTVAVADGEMYIWGYDADYGGYRWHAVTIQQIDGEGDWVNVTVDPYSASMAGDGTRYAYSAFGFFTEAHRAVAIALSVDGGEHWVLRETPLRYYETWEELQKFQCDALFTLDMSPRLDKVWTHVPSTWAGDFRRQENKW